MAAAAPGGAPLALPRGLPPPELAESTAGAGASSSSSFNNVIQTSSSGHTAPNAPAARASTAKLPDFDNVPPFSFESSQDRQSKPIQACVECRRRKVKCDRVFPCGPCKMRNDAHNCEEYVRSKPSEPSGYTLVSDFRILANRVAQLEQFLTTLYRQNSPINTPAILQGEAALANLGNDIAAELTSASMQGFVASNGRDLEITDWQRHFQDLLTSGVEVGDNATFNISQLLEPLGSGANGHQPAQPLDNQDPSSQRQLTGQFEQQQASAPAMVETSRSQSPVDNDHVAALALEDMALHRYQARTKTLLSETPAVASRYLPAPSLGPLLSLRSILSREGPTIVIPTHLQLRQLSASFVESYLWIQRCIHIPSFQHELETLLASSAEMGGDVYFEAKFVPFLSLLMATCATSMHFATAEDLRRYGVVDADRSKICTDWIEATLTLLHAADWLQSHRLVCLQAFVILGPVLAATDRSETHWSLLGSAIKVGQALNLSRLLPEDILQRKFADKSPQALAGSTMQSILTREIGRRTWALMVEEDWLFAPEHNNSYSVQPRQNLTGEISNVNDADLTLAIQMAPHQPDTWTESSYMIWRYKMIVPFREFMDGCPTSQKATLKLIHECDAKLHSIGDNLPRFYQLETDIARDYGHLPQLVQQIQVERVATQSGLHTRLLRVHRAGLGRAFRNETFQSSREACVNSAKVVLRLAEDWLSLSIPIAGWWPVVYGIYSASVILFITMCRNAALADAHEQSIHRAMQIMRLLAGPHNQARDRMANTLERLLASRQRRRGSQTGASVVPTKRKHDADTSTPSDERIDTFVNNLVEGDAVANPPSDKGSDRASLVSSFSANYADFAGATDFMFDFGEYGDPFADIMRITEGTSSSGLPNLWQMPLDAL